jgi:hypothetical protein
MLTRTWLAAIGVVAFSGIAIAAEPLRLATFEADITPPLGAPLCDGLVQPARVIDDPLKARGIVLLADGGPIVLCALDWVGIGNRGYDAFRESLATAAGTRPSRVAVHCLHQHDAPGCDFAADELLRAQGLENAEFNVAFAREAMQRVAAAIGKSLKQPLSVTHVSFGKAKVEKVASTRRVLGPDGKVKHVRWTATKDPAVQAEPEGTIDPFVHLVGFWDGEQPIASLTYYATHPQSYYGNGAVSCDFPGLARGLRDQQLSGVMHLHFNGAGGNVTAGKYNDGSPENRPVLAQRLADGMRAAWESAEKQPIAASDVEWRIQPAALPPAAHLDEAKLRAALADETASAVNRMRAARDLAWLLRCQAGAKIDITCLRLGPGYVLHLPGELFVEYQLAAQQMRPQSPVLMAAYGDYGPGYIGLQQSYGQGGYETGPVSRVAPEVENVLMTAIRDLLR